MIKSYQVNFLKKVKDLSSCSNLREDTLYHYTTQIGLKKIIESGYFRGTHFHFFDDPTEVSHGLYFIQSELRSLINNEENEMTKKVFKEFVGQALDLHSFLIHYFSEFYIVSFSEEGDFFSQWYKYADQGKGYAIGINITDFPMDKELDLSNVKYPIMIKVIYLDEQKKEITRDFYQCIKEEISNYSSIEDSGGVDYIVGNIKNKYIHWFEYLSLLFKNENFYDEKEVRIIDFRLGQNPKQNNYDVKLYERNKFRENELVPYIQIKFKDNKIPFNKIVLGPRVKDIYRSSIKHLLFNNDYKIYPEMPLSKVPLG